MPDNPLVLVQLSVAALCAAGGVLLLRHATESRAALGVLLLLLACHVTVLAGQELGFLGWHVTVAHVAGLAYGPLFFGFVRGLLFQRTRNWLAWLPHAVPVVVFLLAFAARVLSDVALALGVFASLGTYLALSLTDLLSYRGIIERTRSSVPHVPLAWLTYAVVGLVIVYALDVGAFLGGRVGAGGAGRALEALLFVAQLVYVAGFVVAALRFPRLFVAITVEDIHTAAARTAHEAKPPLVSAEAAAQLESIEAYMREHRPFLRSELTLAELAAAVGLPPRVLSQLVNRGRGRNFADWVNHYRLEEVQRLLTDPCGAARSVLDAMYAAGFSSKSTFNALFKASTGLTPTEFIGNRRHKTAR
ncbi:MAG TPA: AraC family transcriptional regulator [Steroidobacteraceae bacterium]|nr:AraC family transcriptional regulator [Steroidobacteraceae bacterium]